MHYTSANFYLHLEEIDIYRYKALLLPQHTSLGNLHIGSIYVVHISVSSLLSSSKCRLTIGRTIVITRSCNKSPWHYSSSSHRATKRTTMPLGLCNSWFLIKLFLQKNHSIRPQCKATTATITFSFALRRKCGYQGYQQSFRILSKSQKSALPKLLTDNAVNGVKETL